MSFILVAALSLLQTSQQTEQQRVRDIYLPSAPHAALQRMVGTWEQVTRYSSGTATPVETRGRVVNRSILDGRFVVSEGSARQDNGPLITGAMMIFGFDGRTREHTVIVLDTFGTYYVTASGVAAEARTTTMHGETKEGNGTKKFDVVLEWIDDDTYETRIIFHVPGREPVIAVAATHRRVREASTGTL